MGILKKEMAFFIQTKDVDQQDRIKPQSVFDLFQDIAGLHAEELGIGYRQCLADHRAWVILYEEIEILNQPPYLADVKVITWPKPKHRIEFEREFLMVDQANRPLVKGISNWIVIDSESRRPVRASSIEFEGTYYDFTNYPFQTPRALQLDTSKLNEQFSYSVVYDDLDHNGHMNNARYIGMIYRHFTTRYPNAYFKKVAFAFIKETKVGETLHVSYGFTAFNEVCFVGTVAEHRSFECKVELEE